MMNTARGALALSLVLGSLALAQQTALTMDAAVKTAFSKGADIASSAQSLQTAQDDLRVAQADPTTLVVALTQSKQAVALAQTQLNASRITVLGNVATAYLNLYEAQQNLEILNAQVALDSRNLDVAKAKLAQNNGTALDVRKAETTLATSRQNLANGKAQLPTLSNRLEVLLGSDLKGDLTVADPPAYKEVKYDLAALEKGLDANYPSVQQAAQSVELQTLNVKLADNDYTPINTLTDAKSALASAQRSLDTARKNAVTTLRDSARNVTNTLEQVKIANTSLQNDADTLKQDQQRFKNGSISRVQLQTSELTVLRSQYALTQAQDNYFKALNALSSAAGVDVTGMVARIGGGS
jgi:outer membrane protein TolC